MLDFNIENPHKEIDLEKTIAHVLNVQSFDKINDERQKVVAGDLLIHCISEAVVQLDVSDLEKFAIDQPPFFVTFFQGELQTVEKEIGVQMSMFLDGKKYYAVVCINYYDELTCDELDKLFKHIRNETTDMDILWSYAYNEHLPKNEIRVDLLVKNILPS